MTLSDRQIKRLRKLGHNLKPYILIGDKGLTEAVTAECETTLTHHELIKVRARGHDKAAREQVFNKLCEQMGAQLIQQVGMTALIYRPHPKQPKIDAGRA